MISVNEHAPSAIGLVGEIDDQTLQVLAFGGFGGIILLITVLALREAAAMKRWPIAQGRVLSSKVEEYKELVGKGNTRTRMTLYRPVVVYEYEVSGQRFKGSRITQSPGLNRSVPDFAEKIVQRYPEQSAIDVRYNPKRPGDAVLEPRVPTGWIFGAVIAVALLVLAAHAYYR